MDPETEAKWQDRWAAAHIFEPEIDNSKEKFFITVPWPYTNSSLHVGHGRTYTVADIIARYKRLVGYNVLFPMAFHQSGTPILAFSERIRRGDEKTLSLYRDTLSEYEKPEDIPQRIEEFKEPEKIAAYFSDRVIKDFISLGYSIDWRRRFTSADPFYQDFVRWQFNKLDKLGLIKNGEYPVVYSIDDKNAVGEDDISDGDIDKVSVEEFTAVVFHGEEYNLIAASLRPETVFGITNLWVSPKAKYVKFEMDGKYYVVSEEGLEKLSFQKPDVKRISDIDVSDILSKKFRTPFKHKQINVYKSGFVDPDNGTGIVYSVPGHAIWDYVAILDAGLNLMPIRVLETTGTDKSTVVSLIAELGISSLADADKLKEATQRLYKIEFYEGKLLQNNDRFSGMSVEKAREAIKAELFEKEDGFIFYETSRKAVTRGGSKVIAAVLSNQWFIDYSVGWWKKASHDIVNSMLYHPEFYRNAMNDAVDWLRERPCARRRGIGTKLPFDREWVIESLSDSTLYPAVYTNVQHYSKIRDKVGTITDDLIEYIFTEGPEESLEKYGEDVRELARAARTEKDYWYGVDIRLTAPAHLSNHLAFYIMNHAALMPKRDAPRGIIISGMLLASGAKMSKSKGNAISLLKLTSKYTADLYRLFVAVNADISSILDWNESEIAAVRKKYESFVDAVNTSSQNGNRGNRQVENWFRSKFNQHLKEYFEKMAQFDIRGAYISVFYEVLNDLKYVESRGGNLSSCISSIRDEWLKIMSPVIPHTCEEIWEKFGNNGFVSAQTMKPEDIGAIDHASIDSEKYLQDIVTDVREIIKATGITPSIIEIQTCDRGLRTAAEHMMKNELSSVDPEFKQSIPDFMKNKKNIDLTVENELEVLEENKTYLESVLSSRVSISEAAIGKGKKNAWPGRPLIRLN